MSDKIIEISGDNELIAAIKRLAEDRCCLKAELAEAVRIIEELDSHEGCEGWSHKLRVELDAFLKKHKSTT